MKRFLLLILALCSALPALAYYAYDTTISGGVKISDLCYFDGGKWVYEYRVEYDQAGINRSDKKTYV